MAHSFIFCQGHRTTLRVRPWANTIQQSRPQHFSHARIHHTTMGRRNLLVTVTWVDAKEVRPHSLENAKGYIVEVVDALDENIQTTLEIPYSHEIVL